MKKILLVCNAGMSTSLLVKKMEDAAKEMGLEVVIEAHPSAGIEEQKGKWDACLIGPQIKFALDTIKEKLDIPTEVIEMRTYGLADGKKALEHGLSLIK